MLLMNRQLHTRFQPETDAQVSNKQADQKTSHDKHIYIVEIVI